jgi:hypothetical protein
MFLRPTILKMAPPPQVARISALFPRKRVAMKYSKFKIQN